MKMAYSTWIILILCVVAVQSYPRNKFFDYGTAFGDKLLPAGNHEQTSLGLETPLTFVNDTHYYIYINTDGLLTFNPIAPGSLPYDLGRPVADSHTKMIAPFLTDVNTTYGGQIYGRFSKEIGQLDAASRFITTFFSTRDFRATGVTIVTWEDVPIHPSRTRSTITFQAILPSDGTRSYAIFLYDDDNEFPDPGVLPYPPFIGFASGLDRNRKWSWVTVGGETDTEVYDATRASNVYQSGVMAFQIDTNPAGPNYEQEGSGDGGSNGGTGGGTGGSGGTGQTGGSGQTGGNEGGQTGGEVSPGNPFDLDECQSCSFNSTCQEFSRGYCCVCNAGNYGNGRTCIWPGNAQRLNGDVSGSINNLRISSVNLHAYVNTNEGLAYTAISPLPQSISYSMQLLSPIGELIGWLFAIPSGKGINGFTLTGGLFTSTMNFNFESGEQLTVVNEFAGVDVDGYIRSRVTLNGNVPEIEAGVGLRVDDHKDVYVRRGNGIVHSFIERTLLTSDNQQIRYTLDHTIEFDECSGDDADQDPRLNSIRISYANIYLTYDPIESILRFRQQAKVSQEEEPKPDSCRNNNCDRNAQCLAQGNTFRCRCNNGFEGDGYQCRATDPCRNNGCDINAYCYPRESSYECFCNEGYAGDGYTCRAADPCRNHRCDINAYCYPRVNLYECYCNDGYTGDGFTCKATDPCRNNRCDINAYCYPHEGSYQCFCTEGYEGDGFTCRVEDPCIDNQCDANATCYPQDIGYMCKCNSGHEGNGFYCTVRPPTDNCAQNQCDANAYCTPTPTSYQCTCNEGYTGNGFLCEVRPPTDNCAQNQCDTNAYCTPTSTNYRCICNDGYTGNGFICEDNCVQSQCDVNAYCTPTATSYRCTCNDGYTGNGFLCQVAVVDPCVGNQCHADAICQAQEGLYTCQCRPGYEGNGFDCNTVVVNPCNDNQCHADADCLVQDEGYLCQCISGFEGNGYDCNKIQDPCANSGCHADAICLAQDGSYSCTCQDGFEGNGFTCTAEVNPCINNECDPNAYCTAVKAGYICTCNLFYQGDGYTCKRETVDRCDNCDGNAECIPVANGYRCVCNSGFKGDGQSCEDVDECKEGGGYACHRDADCYNSIGSHSCYCRNGFVGDGLTCSEIPRPAPSDAFLMFSQGMNLMRMPLDPTQKGGKMIMRARQTIVGVSYDCQDEYAYWTDVSSRTINRAKYDGSDHQTLIYSGLSSPEGIAVDWLSRNMYWTDSGFDQIEVAKIDGSNRRMLFDTDLINPRGIVVDPIGGLLYWTDWDRSSPKIEKSWLDGTKREVMIDTNIGLPNGLTLDYVSQQICWADAGTKKIECMNINGNTATRYTVFPSTEYPFGLTAYNYNLYWTDWDSGNIQTINKNGGLTSESLQLPKGGNGRVYDVTAVTACPGGSNACSSRNGGCSSLCLPTPGNQRTCACPTSPSSNEVPCVP